MTFVRAFSVYSALKDVYSDGAHPPLLLAVDSDPHCVNFVYIGKRPRHTDKATEAVIAAAEAAGWRVVYPMGHWGYLYCARDDCRIRISGTPQNGESHARRIARQVARCPH